MYDLDSCIGREGGGPGVNRNSASRCAMTRGASRRSFVALTTWVCPISAAPSQVTSWSELSPMNAHRPSSAHVHIGSQHSSSVRKGQTGSTTGVLPVHMEVGLPVEGRAVVGGGVGVDVGRAVLVFFVGFCVSKRRK